MRYGFVTFSTASSAYDAVEKAPTDPLMASYNVAFGGRRQFCDTNYSDLGIYLIYIIYIKINN